MNNKINQVLKQQNELTLLTRESKAMQLKTPKGFRQFAQDEAYNTAAHSIPTVVTYFRNKKGIIGETDLERFFQICTNEDLENIEKEYQTSLQSFNVFSKYMEKMIDEIQSLNNL